MQNFTFIVDVIGPASTDANKLLNNSVIVIHVCLREGVNEKKTFSFGHCPNHLNPPPHHPNSGNLVLFFRKSKFKI